VLSGLLQIGELISSGAEFDQTLRLITERLAQLEETEYEVYLQKIEFFG